MRALLRRAIVALALAPCLVLGPVMPQEHVHDAEDSHAVAHSHVEFHQHEEALDVDTPDRDAAEIAADDEGVVWVNGAGLTPLRAFHLVPTLAVVDEPSLATPDVASATRQPDIDSSPPHGPPRPSFSLRGPPLASA